MWEFVQCNDNVLNTLSKCSKKLGWHSLLERKRTIVNTSLSHLSMMRPIIGYTSELPTKWTSCTWHPTLCKLWQINRYLFQTSNLNQTSNYLNNPDIYDSYLFTSSCLIWHYLFSGAFLLITVSCSELWHITYSDIFQFYL